MQTEDANSKEQLDAKLQLLMASHDKERQVMDKELDVELTLQKESVSNAITGVVAEEIKNAGMKHLSEV